MAIFSAPNGKAICQYNLPRTFHAARVYFIYLLKGYTLPRLLTLSSIQLSSTSAITLLMRPSADDSFIRPVVIVSAVALFLRLALALLLPVVPANSDPTAYVTFARNLAAGNGFGWGPEQLTAFWPPGPSAFYAMLFMLGGERLWLISVAHAFIGTATVTATMLIAARLHSRQVAIVAGLLLAFWPQLILFTTIPSSEPLFNLLIVILTLTWGTNRLSNWQRGLTSGVLCALASLARPTGLLTVGVLAIADFLRTRSLQRLFVSTSVAGVVTLALMAPWAYRNSNVFGRPFLTSSSGSANMWLGNNSRQLPPDQMWPPEIRGMSEAQRADFLSAEVSQFIRSNPLEYLKRSFIRFFRVHDRESIGVVWNSHAFEAVGIEARPQMLIKIGCNLFYWPVLLLSVIGLAMFARTNGVLALLSHPMALLWLYFALVHALTVMQDRYHVPSIPSMAVFAAFTICRIRPAPPITKTSLPA